MLKKILLIPKAFKSSFKLPQDSDFINSFQQLGLPKEVLKHLEQFDSPSEIQSKSMKILMQGSDLIGIAPTGSGKTLAFAIPALIKSANVNQRKTSISTVIVCPTRQLSNQITQAIRPIATQLRLRVANLFGGAPKKQQFYAAKTSSIVVATPGRLKDYITSGPDRLANVQSLILDEADRMLDLGFEQQLKEIVSQTPLERQTSLFSATWQPQIQGLVQDYILPDAYYVQIGNNTTSLNPNIQQLFQHLSYRNAKQNIAHIINTQQTKKVLIFCNTKNETRDLAFELNDLTDRKVNYITSDLTQDERSSVMNSFREEENNIMVATDVASRGIDVKDIGLVINYGFPSNSADFIHRIGRTGRGGKTGKSVTYIFKGDGRVQKDLRYIATLFTNEGLQIPNSLKNIIKDIGISLFSSKSRQPTKKSEPKKSEFKRSQRYEDDQFEQKDFKQQSPKKSNKFNKSKFDQFQQLQKEQKEESEQESEQDAFIRRKRSAPKKMPNRKFKDDDLA